LALLALAAISACGQSGSRQVEVNEAWASATPAGATVAAVYMEVIADERDTLLSATTTVADRIEMHTSSEENGMMRMRPLSTVELQAGEPFVFAPGGAHFMLLGLRQPLRAGMRFPLTLQFEKAGTRNIQVDVKELGSR
jgi:copper(I)-binding protein